MEVLDSLDESCEIFAFQFQFDCDKKRLRERDLH